MDIEGQQNIHYNYFKSEVNKNGTQKIFRYKRSGGY